jgi:pimeloyl-ACP methyl ester carboxylesterase
MAAGAPRPPVEALVLMAGYFGEFGPTAKRLVGLGGQILKLIPRDLRHAVLEVTGQAPQLPYMHKALAELRKPIHVIHGDKDDYAPLEVAEKLVAQARTRRPVHFTRVPGGSHFLNEGPPEQLIALLETAIPQKKGFPWPAFALPSFEISQQRDTQTA